MERFHVRIARENLFFSAAHFITFASGECERLHGHNYRVAAEVYGPLGESQYVIDFLLLEESLRAILAELDHRVLLPSRHPAIRLSEDDKEVAAVFAQRRWVFPRGDCVLLPIANTTAERLAEYIGQRLFDQLAARGLALPELLRIEVDECFGHWAACELQRP